MVKYCEICNQSTRHTCRHCPHRCQRHDGQVPHLSTNCPNGCPNHPDANHTADRCPDRWVAKYCAFCNQSAKHTYKHCEHRCRRHGGVVVGHTHANCPDKCPSHPNADHTRDRCPRVASSFSFFLLSCVNVAKLNWLVSLNSNRVMSLRPNLACVIVARSRELCVRDDTSSSLFLFFDSWHCFLTSLCLRMPPFFWYLIMYKYLSQFLSTQQRFFSVLQNNFDEDLDVSSEVGYKHRRNE